MHHDHAEMTHDQKRKPEVNSRDVIKQITRALNLQVFILNVSVRAIV